jgi:hypothetical protein
MTHEDQQKYDLACDLAHELFLPSHALTLEQAPPERLYAALEEKGYAWDGQAWQPRTAREGRG